MMPARKRCHSARDSLGMTGASEVRPCLTALWRTAALLAGVFGPRFPIGYEVGCDAERKTSIRCHSFEKLFWSFGLWDYGKILELCCLIRVLRQTIVQASGWQGYWPSVEFWASCRKSLSRTRS